MKRIHWLVMVTLIVLTGGGCSLADLRTAQILSGERAQLAKDGRRLLALAVWRQDKAGRWDDFEEWTVAARDEWESGLIRRLTPLTQNEQEIVFRFRTDKSAAAMTLADGRKQGTTYGIDENGPYTQSDGEREYGKVGKLDNYLEPVRDYFFWPQTLVNYRTVLAAEEGVVNGQTYHRIFVSDGDPGPSADTDQYVVWLNKRNLRIEYIEFTLRRLLKSYRGVVRYTDYRPVEGILLPHRITLLDRIGTESYSHEFIVRQMSFKLPETKLGFAIEIKPFTLNLGRSQ